jgi:cell division protein FtsB
MQADKGSFFRDAGPHILRLEQRSARWARLDAVQFRGLVVALLALAFCALVITWGRVRVLANGYQIAELKLERDRLMAEHRRLERRLDEMQSLEYAEQAARQRLGMVDINPNQVITLHKQTATESLMEGVSGLFGGREADAASPKPQAKAGQGGGR